MEAPTPRLALWVLLVALGAATILGELALFGVGLGSYALAVPVVTVGVGLAYLAWKTPARRATTPEEEPFDDPVEEAVRADASQGAAPSPPFDAPAPGPVAPTSGGPIGPVGPGP